MLYMIVKHLQYLGVHCLSKCGLGPVATRLVILLPAVNYFGGSFNSPSQSIV